MSFLFNDLYLISILFVVIIDYEIFTKVSRELMRVAITPHELWHDGLESAAQLYLESKDLVGMTAVLSELHEAMNDTFQPQPSGKVRKPSFFTIIFFFITISYFLFSLLMESVFRIIVYLCSYSLFKCL